MSENENVESTGGALVRSITWKQGLFIALGVPILILPSLVDMSTTAWAFTIVLWTICVIQGFIQNTSYGEMVTTFPRAAGLPGCAQVVFEPKDKTKKYNMGKMIGAFCAWCYWFAWTPVVSIFSMLIGDYLISAFPDMLGGIEPWVVYVVVVLVIVVVMTLISARGLTGGSTFGLIMALLAIVPLVVILIGVYFTGNFDFANIQNDFLPPDWEWGPVDIVFVFACFAIMQWSGCAWETAAVYGPEYKDPGKDTPKALFACGIICLVLYFFVSFTTYGAMGQAGIEDEGYSTMVPIAQMVFGDWGGAVAIILLISAMILIIQTGFLGSSRTLYYMSHEGNMPKYLGKQNKNGMPLFAFLTVAVFNSGLTIVMSLAGGSVMVILSASSVAYCFAHVVCQSAYYKSKTDARFKDLERPFSAPRGWKYVSLVLVVYEAAILIPCLLYWMTFGPWNDSDIPWLPVALGILILLAFFPIWFYTQKTNPGDIDSKGETAEE